MIEIPGYRILRQLGRGGMATVYLAVQESVQREVALKVMAPTLVGPEFGERFLREARIAARLRHPHIVQVHDVGRSGDWHFIAMEYLGGGPLLRPGEARDVGFALRVVREIADALDYAHGRGVIHRDVKPDNILLRDDGAAVLTDFGIARASDTSRMTQAGTIIGTPHYIAPEQATGQPSDGRADLYALGVLFHELLLGRVPFHADDWVAVGLMHISAPVPQLPAELSMLQPLLERMLAKKPDERFQSGADLADAIEAVEARLHPRAGAARKRARRVEPTLAPGAGNEQSEPGLGRLDAVPDRPSSRPRRAARAPRWPWVTALVLVLAAIGAWFAWPWLQQPWPQTQHEQIVVAATEALHAGHLDGDDGAGALYQRALAMNPDDARARRGLTAVGEAFVTRAEAAAADGRIDDARAALGQARRFGVAASRIEAIEHRLADAGEHEAELAALVQQAQAALAAGRIDDGDDAALALYRRALQLAPDSEVARHGQRETLSRMLARADAAINRGAFDEAATDIDTVAGIDPAHLELASLRARLTESREAVEGAHRRQLDAARQLLRRGQLEQARTAFQDMLTERADDGDARDGLRAVADAWLAQAEQATADFRFDDARGHIAQARATLPTHPALRRAETRLTDLEQRAGRAATAPVDHARVQAELTAAARAVQAGNLLHPPGDSAYDRYRAVLRLDRDNAEAAAGLAALPAEARRRFEEAIARNRLGAAHGYVEGLNTLAPTDPALPDMRRRLARSLLGFADERLGAGEIERARDAINLAAELDPGSPDLPSLRARLEQARR